jgi:mono/diheme cytochrome c family protein
MRSPTLRSRLVVTLSAALLIGACASAPPEVPVGADGELDAMLVVGRDVYAARCSSCHGSSGDGGTGPRLAGVVSDVFPDPADQAAVIAEGRDNMPGFASRLSDEQIDAVVRYTREVLG